MGLVALCKQVIYNGHASSGVTGGRPYATHGCAASCRGRLVDTGHETMITITKRFQIYFRLQQTNLFIIQFLYYIHILAGSRVNQARSSAYNGFLFQCNSKKSHQLKGFYGFYIYLTSNNFFYYQLRK